MPRSERQMKDVEEAMKRAREDVRRNPVSVHSAGRLVEERKNYLDRLSRELDDAGQTNTERTVFERYPPRPRK